MTPCRLCGHPAVAIFALSAGCVVYPDDRRQALCPQHIVRATPLAEMRCVEDLTDGSLPLPAGWIVEAVKEMPGEE